MKSLFFFDDCLLRAREGLDRKQGQPMQVKELALERHSELSRIGAAEIRYDELRGCYGMYASCIQKKDSKLFYIRLETDDPYNWPAPHWTSDSGPLWTRAENVVLDQHGNPLICFIILPLFGTPLAERGYFMTLNHYPCDGEAHPGSAVTAFSQDGLRFAVNKRTRWAPHRSDTGNFPVYNPFTDQYMIFCRPEFYDRRVAQVATSDLKTFSPVTVVLQPDIDDPVGREFYGLSASLYEDVFIGMLFVYDSEPSEKGHPKMQGTNQMQLAYSYNGRNWYRGLRETFIPRTEAGTSLGGEVYSNMPVRTPDNRLLFVVGGHPGDHGVDDEECPEEWTTWRTYLYDMRLDGFVYLKTRARYGMIQTKSVVLQGGELSINVRTTPSGYVKVAVLDEKTMEPLSDYTLEDAIPITGDELFAKVRWRKRENLDELKGRSVVLEVNLREAELYALRFSYWVALGHQPHERL
jgi:hypothetical protein